MVMIATSLLNRLMVVEYGLAAAVPAGLVAWHYAVQLTRPMWGQGSDKGRLRTPWILFGMALLALGAAALLMLLRPPPLMRTAATPLMLTMAMMPMPMMMPPMRTQLMMMVVPPLLHY